MSDIIHVGIAELKTVFPPKLIRTNGLGSCVGVVIYDEECFLAGMAHVMLPSSSLAREKTFKPGKYADTAIQTLIRAIRKAGSTNRLRAKIAGGAQMFQFRSQNEWMRIGERNVQAVKQQLHGNDIVLVAADVGGHCGRSIEFNPETFVLSVRKVNAGVIEL